ncbi:MAG: TniQ family protein [Stellaceae bacterium]
MTRRLPLHPQPLPDEALSSWVRRLSAVYRLEPHRFIEAALGFPSPADYLGVLDDHPPEDFLCTLTERTGAPRERVRAMTLAGYGALLMGVEVTAQDHNSAALYTDYVCQFGSLAPTAPRRTMSITGLGTNWRPWICADLLDDHPRSCRRCLASDRVPYTRIRWRAAWMASCPVHGEMLEPFYQGTGAPAGSYRWVPARPASPEIIALDRLTLAAVTTGTVTLPAGDRVHAGVWLRGLRTLVDEMTRPSGMLRRGAYASVARIWRDCGLAFHQGLGRLTPFEAMSPERRELVLRVTSRAAHALISGELPALKENEPALLRPPLREEPPDLPSPRPPEYRWPRLPWWEAKISQARRDPYVAWGVRELLNLSAGRRDRAEMDAYLAAIGVPIMTNPPKIPPVGATANI